MAAPSYTTDLVDWIADSDTTAWGELVGAIAGGAPDEVDTESALQGTNTVSQSTNTTSVFSMARILAASADLTNKVALVWHGHGVATALLSYASNGLGVAFATDLTNWESFTVAGNDVPPFPYGKWINSAVDPAFATNDRSNGTPPAVTAIYGIGSIGQLSASVAKGQPHVCDIIRTGRAEARINGGETANYATFAGFAAVNDAQTARWGLIQATTGGYLWKGLLTLGYSSAVDFRDSNQTLFVQDCRKVASGFSKIEIRQASSRVDWTGITIVALSPSTNLAKGALEVIDNADVNFDGCLFVDMTTFGFLANSTILNTTFRRCGLVTQGGATLTKCIFDQASGAVALLSGNPSLVTYCQFISDGTGHAIEITTPGTYSLTGHDYVGYASSDGSTGNEVIYNNSGGAVTLNVSLGDTPTIRNGSGASTTVNATVTFALSNVVSGTTLYVEATAGGLLTPGDEMVAPTTITVDPYSTNLPANQPFKALLANASSSPKYVPIIFTDTTGSGFSRRIEQQEDA